MCICCIFDCDGNTIYCAFREENTEVQQEAYLLRFLVKERLYGYPDYVPENSYVTITCYPEAGQLFGRDGSNASLSYAEIV